MRRFASVCAVAVLVLVAASCGDDSDGDSAATTGGEAATTAAAGTTAAAPETTAAAEAEPTVVDVTMADFSYEAPDTIPAGLVTINGTNTSTAEEHQATIVRLNDGVTLEQALGTFAQDEIEGFKLVTTARGARTALRPAPARARRRSSPRATTSSCASSRLRATVSHMPRRGCSRSSP